VASFEVGTAFMQIVPSFRGVDAAIRGLLRDVGKEIDKSIGDALPETLKRSSRNSSRAGADAASKYAGTFGETLRKRLDSAFKGLGDVEVNDGPIAALQKDLQELRDQHVSLDIDDATALAAVELLHARLKALRKDAADIPAHVDLRGAEQDMAAIVDFVRQRSALIEQEGAESGRRYGGSFAAQFRDRVGRAFEALPELKVGADVEGADSKVDELRARLDTLRTKRVGIDIDDARAVAEVRALMEELDRLARSSPSIQVRANAAAAYAELRAVDDIASKLDGKDVNLRVATDNTGFRQFSDEIEVSIGRLGALIALGTSIGPGIIPVAAAAAAAIGGIGTAAIAAAAGVGVLALASVGIADAVKAQDKYQQDSAKSAKSLAAANTAVENSASSVRAAERGLASARENAGYAAQRSSRAIVEAQQAVDEANKAAAKSQRDLTKAIEDAQQKAEDRALALRDNALAQRQANLDIAKAKQDLDKVIADPKATKAQREQADITYQQQVLHLEELRVTQKRSAAEQQKYIKDGVKGDDQVKAAQERVQKANDGVVKAQAKVAQAVQDSARSQHQSAQAIVSAQESLAQAHRQAAQAAVNAGVAGGEALDNLKTAMDNLSPAGQRFAKFIYGLKGTFLDLRNAASDNLLPGIQEAIEILLPSLPKVADFVGRVATAMGELAVQAARGLSGPTFRKFFAFVDTSVVPTIKILGEAAGNVATGVTALFLALTPFNASLGSGLLKLTQGFAEWAKSLSSNRGFQDFLQYAKENGPRVVELIEDLVKLLVHLVVAAAPVGVVVVKVLDAIVAGLDAIPTGVLTALISAFALFGAVVLPLAGALRTYRVVTEVAAFATKAYQGVVGTTAKAVSLFGGAADGGSKKVSLLSKAIDQLGFSQRNTIRGTGDFAQGLGIVASSAGTAKKSADEAAVSVTTVGAESGKAAKGAEALAGSAGKVAGTAGGFAKVGSAVKGIGSAALGVVGGPLGLLITGGIVGFQMWQASAAKARAETEKLRSAAEQYGSALKDGVTPESAEAAKNLLRQDQKMQGLVQTSHDLGVSTHTLVDAINGDKAARAEVISRIDEQIQKEKLVASQVRNGSDAETVASKAHMDRAKNLETMRDALKDANSGEAEALGLTNELSGANESAADSVTDIKTALDDTNPSVSTFKFGLAALEGLTTTATGKMELYAAMAAKVSASNFDAKTKTELFGRILDDIGASAKTSGSTFDALAATFTTIASSSVDAASKVGLLRKAMQQMYGAAQAQTEANENLVLSQFQLRDRLAESSAGFDLNKAKSYENAQAIKGNRDALKDALKANQEKYLQDIVSGQGEDKARQVHDENTKALLNQIPAAQRNSGAVKDLVAQYGSIPPTKATNVTTPGLDQAIDRLIESHAIQLALDMKPPGGHDFIQSEIDYLKKKMSGASSIAVSKAEGGLIGGWSPTPTADNIPAWLTANEFVHPVSTVDYYGVATMEAIRKKQIPREMLRGYATGGLVSGTWPIQITSSIQEPVTLEAMKAAYKNAQDVANAGISGNAGPGGAGPGFLAWPSSPAAQRGDTGVWHNVLDLVKKSGIPYSFGNSYRPGDPLWHGSGRAIDFMGYNQDTLAQFFMDMRPRVLELIHRSNTHDYGITRGRIRPMPHQWPLHRNHLHIAMASGGLVPDVGVYDSGGYLPTGLSAVYNGTGRPEPVMTAQQMELLTSAADSGSAGTTNYHFGFRDTTLTASRLRAMQDRDAAIARQGRAR
jgi:hypothetical protein